MICIINSADKGKWYEKESILQGNTALGIEFGSTRIKAVLIDETKSPIAQGSYEWENRLENNIWTYSIKDIITGLQQCYSDLAENVKRIWRYTQNSRKYRY